MRMAKLYADAGMDIIAVVDPMISQISVAHFEQFMQEPFTKLFDHIRSLKALSAFFVCGDATRNIESMCKTRPDSISIDENVNLAAAKAITDRYGIAIGGNIPLTTVLLHGSQQDVMKCVVDLLDSVSDRTGLIVAPGCDMPYDVPVENGIAVSHAVLNEADTREMLKNYVAVTEDIDIELPDYANLAKPFIEVFTLDSATCAACGYMMGAANRAKADFGDRIDMVEYKFTEKDNIARCKRMGVPNLPSMYINGVLKFRSLVPSRKELADAIEAVIK
jgi:uroporphyrinogen decarboxylase